MRKIVEKSALAAREKAKQEIENIRQSHQRKFSANLPFSHTVLNSSFLTVSIVVRFEVQVSNPNVIIPRSSSSGDILFANLGNITLSNEFQVIFPLRLIGLSAGSDIY